MTNDKVVSLQTFCFNNGNIIGRLCICSWLLWNIWLIYINNSRLQELITKMIKSLVVKEKISCWKSSFSYLQHEVHYWQEWFKLLFLDSTFAWVLYIYYTPCTGRLGEKIVTLMFYANGNICKGQQSNFNLAIICANKF